MMLVKSTEINRKYFKPGSRPTRKRWAALVNARAIGGKIFKEGGFTVYIDEDDFLQRISHDGNDDIDIREAALTLLE